jgi:hypothetical protein
MDHKLASQWEPRAVRGRIADALRFQFAIENRSDGDKAELLAQFEFWDEYISLLTVSAAARQHMLLLEIEPELEPSPAALT